MALTILCGRRTNVNYEILSRAAKRLPALIIDGANCADPHSIMYYSNAEACDEIYVLETELIYKLRDAITDITRHTTHANTRHIFFTTFDALFNYQNDEETHDTRHYSSQITAEHEL